MSALDHYEVKYIYGEANRIADALAIDIPTIAYEEVGTDQFSARIKRIITEDKEGKMYRRL